jgi:hypothetical protein
MTTKKSRIYAVAHKDGKVEYIRAFTSTGALTHVRNKLVLTAEVAEQDDLMKFARDGGKEEDATKEVA